MALPQPGRALVNMMHFFSNSELQLRGRQQHSTGNNTLILEIGDKGTLQTEIAQVFLMKQL